MNFETADSDAEDEGLFDVPIGEDDIDIDIDALEKEQLESHRRYQESLSKIYAIKSNSVVKERSDEHPVERVHISRRGSVSVFATSSSAKKSTEDEDIVLDDVATPAIWQRLIQRAGRRWLTFEEALSGLILCVDQNDNAEISPEVLLLQEVTVPILPDPGSLFLFDETELSEWQQDGYAWKRISEGSISTNSFARNEDRTLTVLVDAFEDDDAFRRHAFALCAEPKTGRRVWLVQYSDESVDGALAKQIASIVQTKQSIATPLKSLRAIATDEKTVDDTAVLVSSEREAIETSSMSTVQKSEKKKSAGGHSHIKVTIKKTSSSKKSTPDTNSVRSSGKDADESSQDMISRENSHALSIRNEPSSLPFLLKPSALLAEAASYDEFKKRRKEQLQILKGNMRHRQRTTAAAIGGAQTKRQTQRRMIPEGLPWNNRVTKKTRARRLKTRTEKKVGMKGARVRTIDSKQVEAPELVMMRKVVSETIARNKRNIVTTPDFQDRSDPPSALPPGALKREGFDWVAHYHSADGEEHYVGTFHTKEEAINAYRRKERYYMSHHHKLTPTAHAIDFSSKDSSAVAEETSSVLTHRQTFLRDMKDIEGVALRDASSEVQHVRDNGENVDLDDDEDERGGTSMSRTSTSISMSDAEIRGTKYRDERGVATHSPISENEADDENNAG
eukprot:g2701.t1